MNIQLFLKLLKTRLFVAHRIIVSKIINVQIWAACSLLIFGYVMQQRGLSADYGVFLLASVVASVGLMEIYYNVANMVMDFEGERSIEYYLTLPAKSSLILMSMVCIYTYIGIILSISALGLGKLILFNKLCLADICWGKLFVITFLGNFLYGVATLAIAAYIGSTSKLGVIWSRVLFPLWYLGGFQFSWETVYHLNAPLSYVLLANPILYLTEGTRAAIQGQEGNISWWICAGMTLFFIMALWFMAEYQMKKRLDCV